MKTTIDLTQFNFNSRIFNQISDCPDTGFVRILVFTGENYQERIKQWFINAEIVYINPTNNKIVYTKVAKSKNEEWAISNDYKVTVVDFQGNPIPNPDFVTEITKPVLDENGEPVLDELGNHQTQMVQVPISETNLPYLTQGAFDRFSEFRVGTTYNLSMRQLLNMSVISDDANGYFDEKENHKTLLETQLEIYNRLQNVLE